MNLGGINDVSILVCDRGSSDAGLFGLGEDVELSSSQAMSLPVPSVTTKEEVSDFIKRLYSNGYVIVKHGSPTDTSLSVVDSKKVGTLAVIAFGAYDAWKHGDEIKASYKSQGYTIEKSGVYPGSKSVGQSKEPVAPKKTGEDKFKFTSWIPGEDFSGSQTPAQARPASQVAAKESGKPSPYTFSVPDLISSGGSRSSKQKKSDFPVLPFVVVGAVFLLAAGVIFFKE